MVLHKTYSTEFKLPDNIRAPSVGQHCVLHSPLKGSPGARSSTGLRAEHLQKRAVPNVVQLHAIQTEELVARGTCRLLRRPEPPKCSFFL